MKRIVIIGGGKAGRTAAKLRSWGNEGSILGLFRTRACISAAAVIQENI